MRANVLITDCNLGDATSERDLLRGSGVDVAEAQCKTEQDVISAVRATDPIALLVQHAPITKNVLESCPRVRVIVRYGTGLDNIDVQTASTLGIAVVATREYAVEEVADHTLALLLALVRGTDRWVRAVKSGDWSRREEAEPPIELNGSTLGLVGFGAVGSRVASRALSFGLRVIAYDPEADAGAFQDRRVEQVGWEELWVSSAFVSLHAPLTADTRSMVNDTVLDEEDCPSFLVNTARGGLIDRPALEAALTRENLRGVGLDVWWQEPPLPDDPLLQHPKVLVTPHIAWLSEGSPARLRSLAAGQLLERLSEHD